MCGGEGGRGLECNILIRNHFPERDINDAIHNLIHPVHYKWPSGMERVFTFTFGLVKYCASANGFIL